MIVSFDKTVQLRVQVVQHDRPGNVTLSMSAEPNKDNPDEDALQAIKWIRVFFAGKYRKVKSFKTSKGEQTYQITF